MSVMGENQGNDIFFEKIRVTIFFVFFDGAKIFEGGWE